MQQYLGRATEDSKALAMEQAMADLKAPVTEQAMEDLKALAKEQAMEGLTEQDWAARLVQGLEAN
jgi:hypothetical protein